MAIDHNPPHNLDDIHGAGAENADTQAVAESTRTYKIKLPAIESLAPTDDFMLGMGEGTIWLARRATRKMRLDLFVATFGETEEEQRANMKALAAQQGRLSLLNSFASIMLEASDTYSAASEALQAAQWNTRDIYYSLSRNDPNWAGAVNDIETGYDDLHTEMFIAYALAWFNKTQAVLDPTPPF